MIIRSINIGREGDYGYGAVDASKPFRATIAVIGQTGKVELSLSPDMSQKIVAIIAEEVAAALAMMAQKGKPLQIAGEDPPPRAAPAFETRRPASFADRERKPRFEERGERPRFEERGDKPRFEDKPRRAAPAGDMVRYRIDVGRDHGVQVKDIVGAIANEAEIDSEHIGRIEIFDDYSTIDLPEGMPKELFKHLKSVWVSGQRLQISRLEPGKAPFPAGEEKRKPGKAKGSAPHSRERGEFKAKSGGRPASKPATRKKPAK